ncbi:MAG: hypothetical protein PF450_13090 [Bacteroidales bacterium]|nr:hypothetical protein [Bacteroidales bacterium]
MKTSKPGELFNPFPGLRPFTQDESHLFFGREGQSKSVRKSLELNNFIAVIGASGSGKSSLIYCGVIPDLKAHSEKQWSAVSTRPGTSPIKNLVASLSEQFDGKVADEDADKLLAGDLSIQEWVKGLVPKGQSLLLVIDQFEEIFRFKKTGASEQSIAEVNKFVELIYDASTADAGIVSVVLTMRSDFIGECSVFQSLTDLINRSNYLIPQMTREDFRKVIEGPVKIGGATIDNELVEQLLDEMGIDSDQLPVLQHALMRTWDYWMLQNDPNKPISIGDYEAIGRMEKALSDHANEAYEELNENQRSICMNIFKTLTEKGGDNRGVRRPNSVDRVAEISKSSPEEIIRIAEVFRTKGRTFLTPYQPVELHENTVIDISHESLMRIWDRLRLWVDEEASSVLMYKRLSEASQLYQEGTTGLWRPPDLHLAANWRDQQKPTVTWAVQYNPAFERAMVYLDTSEADFKKEEENKIRLQKRRLKVTRMFSLVLGGIAVVAMGLFIWTRDLQSVAEKNFQDAQKQTEIALDQTKLAEQRSAEALSARDSAEVARQSAIAASDTAEMRRLEAEAAQALAVERQRQAIASEAEAKKQQKLAVLASDSAKEERNKAIIASQEATQRRMLSIAQSMAVKSEQMRSDTMLKGLLAFQSHSFNVLYEGVSYDPDVFKAAYSGLKLFKGEANNVFKGHSETVGSIVSYGNQVISGSSDGTVISRDMNDTASTVLLSNLPIINKLLVWDQFLYCLTNNSIVKYDFDSGESDIYEFQYREIEGFFITQDGKYILAKANSIILADDYKNQGQDFYTSNVKINVVSYDKQSDILFASLANGQIYYWNDLQSELKAPILLGNIPDANWWAMKYNPEKKILAAGTGNNQGAIYLWDLATASQLTPLRAHTAVITGISFSSDGELMAASSMDGSVSLWQMDDLKTLPIVFNDYPGWVTSLSFSSDDKYVISGGRFGDLKTLPTDINILIDEYCGFLNRELSIGEWQNYVGADIPFKAATCKE